MCLVSAARGTWPVAAAVGPGDRPEAAGRAQHTPSRCSAAVITEAVIINHCCESGSGRIRNFFSDPKFFVPDLDSAEIK